jgi:hypothetical protein
LPLSKVSPVKVRIGFKYLGLAVSLMGLAEAKARLEKRLSELERELELLKLALSLIDEALAQKSFTKASELGREAARATVPQRVTQPAKPMEAGAVGKRVGIEDELKLGVKLSEEVLKSKDGRELARLAVHEKGLVLEPLIEVPSDSPPFLNFLIVKVLNEYRKGDERAARYGDVKPSEKLDFAVFEEAGYVKRLVVWNWREKKRLEDIQRAIKWTLNRVLERSQAQT